jgi:hypothetical protein
MTADSDHPNSAGPAPQSPWAEAWHLWTVFIPRRSITGRLVFGLVLRRHNGCRWQYKNFIEF